MRLSAAIPFIMCAALAAAPKEGDKPTARLLNVRIDVAGKNGRPADPVVISSADELAKAIRDEEAAKAIKGAVDFKTEQVLFFAWAGSGQDRLTVATEDGKRGPEVTVTYSPGRTRDLRQHGQAVAIPKGAAFKVVTQGK